MSSLHPHTLSVVITSGKHCSGSPYNCIFYVNNLMIHQSKTIAGNKLLNYHYAFHSRFMIGCDYCNDWLHGSCVGISTEEASSIETYKCPTCCIEDPFYIEGISSFT